MKKRKVLIPLDGSAFGRQIVPVLCDYVDPEEAELVLLRVALPLVLPAQAFPAAHIGMLSGSGWRVPAEPDTQEQEQSYLWSVQEQEAYRQQVSEELHTVAEPLRRQGYTVTPVVLFGSPAEQIIAYAKAAAVDLIAMTTHGRTGLGRFVLGSVAESVLREVDVPVLLLRTASAPVEKLAPGEALLRSIREPGRLQLAVATDGSTFGEQAINLATVLARQLQVSPTVLVTVSDQDDVARNQQIMGEVVDLVAGVHPKAELTPLVGYPDQVVLDYVEKYPVQLLVLGAFRDRGAGSPKAIGAAAQRIIQSAPVSVLMVKGHHPTIKRILACTEVDDELVVAFATAFARGVGAELELLHVVPSAVASYLAPATQRELTVTEVMAQGTRLAGALQNWSAQMEAAGYHREQIHMRQGNITESILEMARTDGHDLIIVGNRSGPGHFLNTHANQVVSFADQSVLVVRATR
jgi:nucleotide-binding universal stress UspA family protein